MKGHVTVVGVLKIGFGALRLLGVITVLVGMVVAIGVIPAIPDVDPEAITIIGSAVPLIVFFSALGALGAVARIVGGIGLLMWKPWARILVLILAVLDLFSIPIGTLVGIYSIWVLMKNETAQLFAHDDSSQAS